MGISDIVSKTVVGIHKMHQYTSGEALANKIKDKFTYQGEHPMSDCMPACLPGGEKCEECQALKTQMIKQLHKLQIMEEFLDSPPETITELNRNKITECDFCGAPIDANETSCPYCDTEYPDNLVDFDIPFSKTERKNVLLTLAEDVWTKKCQSDEIAMERVAKGMNNGVLGGILSGLASISMDRSDLRYQKASDILQASEYYKVSVSEYLTRAITGEFKTYPLILQEKRWDKQREIDAKNLQQQKELYEQDRRRREKDWELQRELARSKENASNRASMDRLSNSIDDFNRNFG